MRRFTLILGLSLLLSAGVASASPKSSGWCALDSSPRGTSARIDPATPVASGIDLSVRVPGLFSRMIETKVGRRGVLTIPGGGVTATPGLPQLPVLRTLIEIPPGASIELHLEIGSSHRMTLEELGIPARLLPAQAPVPKVPGAKEAAPFIEDTAAYSLDRFIPAEPVAVVDRAVLRGRHLALIEFRPVRYNPTAGSLEVWSEAVLEVRFEGGLPAVALREAIRLASRPMDRWLARAITGLELPGPAPAIQTSGGAAEGALGMLVIAEDDYVAAIQPFLDWKERTGYKIELLRMSDIGGNPTAFDVKAQVQSRYESWSDPSLTYLLLVGDTHVIPIYYASGGIDPRVTDNWYACLDGTDFLPEIAVARISTRSAQETADVVDKLLTYEKATFPDDAWIKDCGFIGTSDGFQYELVEETHDWCIDNFYIPGSYRTTPWSHGHGACDRHYLTTAATTSDISQSIDAGRAIINYAGHGGITFWDGPTTGGRYTADDVRDNLNDGNYPFVISNGCDTGALAVDECFGETWQKTPNAGAIAFLGASDVSSWSVDDKFRRSLHEKILQVDGTPPIGVLINEAKLEVLAQYGNTEAVAKHFEIYNLLSEPSLSLWTQTPRSLGVTHPLAMRVGQSVIGVTVNHAGQPIEGALVAVLKEDDGVFEAGYTGSTGSIDLVLDPAPVSVGPLAMTVTGHDLAPYEGSLDIVLAESPWLIHRSHSVDDEAGGDGDGSTNPAEDLVLTVTVENLGRQPAHDVAAVLSTSTPHWVEVLDESATFPDLGPGEQGGSLADHFGIRAKPGTPDGARLSFGLLSSANGDTVGFTSFSETVESANLNLEEYTIDDSLLGDGNGLPGAGETVDLEITLANIGHRAAMDVLGVLSTDSPYVSISQPTAIYTEIPEGGADTAQSRRYSFSVDPWVPSYELATFTLILTEPRSGYVDVKQFEVEIANCRIVSSLDVPRQLEDNHTVESELDYPHSSPIVDLGVYVDITHPRKGDLSLALFSPNGTACLLHNRTGGTEEGIVTWYDDETQPLQPLFVFFDEDALGTWKLLVTDHATGEEGVLNDWRLLVCDQVTESGATLALSGRELNDSAACDPDGIADVGETVQLDLHVRNVGTSFATGVRVSLTGPETLAVRDETVLLPDLPPDGEATAGFEMLIGAVGCVEPALLVVRLQSDQGQWLDSFELTLEADKEGESFVEDLEPLGLEPAGWTHDAALGIDDWSVSSLRNHTPDGAWSWYAGAPASFKDARLVSPSYELASDSMLEFSHWIETQDGHDGGVLEITDDNGATWTELGSRIVIGDYDRRLTMMNPIGRRAAWTGAYSGWRRVLVDLTPWGDGPPVRFRWRLACDDTVAGAGWWIDDIMIHSQTAVCDAHACGIPGEVRLTALSKEADGIMLEWARDPLCLDYRIWRSTDPTQAAGFEEITVEDDDPADAGFLDQSTEPLLFWIIQGRGPDGEGPWGHYER